MRGGLLYNLNPKTYISLGPWLRQGLGFYCEIILIITNVDVFGSSPYKLPRVDEVRTELASHISIKNINK
jgi:hypothetical protein